MVSHHSCCDPGMLFQRTHSQYDSGEQQHQVQQLLYNKFVEVILLVISKLDLSPKSTVDSGADEVHQLRRE